MVVDHRTAITSLSFLTVVKMELKYSTNSTTFIQDPEKVKLFHFYLLLHNLVSNNRVTAYPAFIQKSEYEIILKEFKALDYLSSRNSLASYLNKLVASGWAFKYGNGYRIIKRADLYKQLNLKTTDNFERAYHPTIEVTKNFNIDKHRVLLGLWKIYNRTKKNPGITFEEGFAKGTDTTTGFKYSLRQMAHNFGYTLSSISKIIKELEDQGHISINRNFDHEGKRKSNTVYLHNSLIIPNNEPQASLTIIGEPVCESVASKPRRSIKKYQDFNDNEKACVDFVNDHTLELIEEGFLSKRYLIRSVSYTMFRSIIKKVLDSTSKLKRRLSEYVSLDLFKIIESTWNGYVNKKLVVLREIYQPSEFELWCMNLGDMNITSSSQ